MRKIPLVCLIECAILSAAGTAASVASPPHSATRLLQMAPELEITAQLAGGGLKVNAGSKLSITATVLSPTGSGISAFWSLSNGTFREIATLDDAASSPTSYDIADSVFERPSGESAAAPVNLVLFPDVMFELQSYSFTLQASFEDASPTHGTATASISFVTNAAPRAGTFGVSPASGTFNDTFSLLASGWVDEPEDLPLRYLFRVQTTAATPMQLLNPMDQTTEGLTLRLPPNAELTDTMITASVVDVFGAEAVATAGALVTVSDAEEAVAAAEQILEELQATAGGLPVNTVYNTLILVTALCEWALAFGGDVARIQALQLDLVGTVANYAVEFFTSTGIVTPELLEGQAAWIHYFSILDSTGTGEVEETEEAEFTADLNAFVLAVVGFLGDSALDATEGTDGDLLLLDLKGAIDLTEATSAVAQFGNANTFANVRNIYNIMNSVQTLRSVDLIEGEDSESIVAENVASNSFVSTVQDEPVTAGVQLGQSGGAFDSSVEISTESLSDGLELQALDPFLFGLTSVPDSLLGNFSQAEVVPPDNGTRLSEGRVVTGVQQVSVTIVEESGGETISLRNGGRIVSTQRVAERAQADADELCGTVADDGDEENCEVLYVCALWNGVVGRFDPLPECVPTPMPEENPTTVQCDCDFSGSARKLLEIGRRRPRSYRGRRTTSASFVGNSTASQTVSLDFTTMIVSSYSVAGANFRSLGDADSSSALMWSVVIGFLFAFAYYAHRGHKLDEEDAAQDKAYLASAQSLEEWLALNEISPEMRRKIFEHGVRTMKDIDILRQLSPAEYDVVAMRLSLDDAERTSFKLALFGSKRVDSTAALISSSGKTAPAVPADEGEAPASPETPEERDAGRCLGCCSWASLCCSCKANGDDAHDDGKLERYKSRKAQHVDNHDDLWYGLSLARGVDDLVNYEERGLRYRIMAATKEAHDYFDALSLHAGDSPTRFVRVVRLAALLASAMMVQALVYQTLYPDDDDYCSDFDDDPEECEEDESRLNSNENRCFFDPDDGCNPTEPDLTARTIVIAAAFALLFIVPLDLIIGHIMSTYLSDSPYLKNGDAPLTLNSNSKRSYLMKLERQRASELAEEEMAFLLRNPDVVPAFYRYMVLKPFGEGAFRYVLKSRVRAAAMEAAHLETELEPVHRLLSLELRTGHITYEDYIEAIRDRKIQVMKIAIRDSLPYLKRRVFKKYTHLAGPEEIVPTYKRRAAMLIVLLYILGCCLYLIGFGATASADVSLAWFVSFVVGEVATALLLMPLRVIILSVLLPSLVRQDVSIERAIVRMPHYSAAALFSRKRNDLVPGLAIVLDARFDSGPDFSTSTFFAAVEQIDEEGEEADDSESDQEDEPDEEDASGKEAAGAETGKAAKTASAEDALAQEKGPSGSVAKEQQTKPASGEKEGQVEPAEAKPEEAPAGLVRFASRGDALRRDSVKQRMQEFRNAIRRKSKTKPAIQSELSVRHIVNIFALPNENLITLPGSETVEEAPEDAAARVRMTRGLSRTKSLSMELLEETDLNRILAEHKSQVAKAAAERKDLREPGTPEAEPGAVTHLTPAFLQSKPSPTGKTLSAAPPPIKETSGAAEERMPAGRKLERRRSEIEVTAAHDLGRELRERSWALKCVTRAFLCLFALLLVVPEPVGDFLIEEGLPIGFAFFVLADFGIDLENELYEVLLQCLFLVVFLFGFLGLVIVVHESIRRTLEKIKEREIAAIQLSDGHGELPRSPRHYGPERDMHYSS